MEPTVIAALIAGVVSVVLALIGTGRQVRSFAWFERWSKVLDGAQTLEQKRIARSRIDYHVRDMAAQDLMRGLWFLYLVGFLILGAGPLAFAFGRALADTFPLLGWLMVAGAILLYVGGLVLISVVPGLLQKKAATKIEAVASGTLDE